MKTEMETVALLQAKASWRVAVSQGLTLLGFKEWVIECTNYPREVRRKGEDDLIARAVSDEFVVVLSIDASHHEAARCVASSIIASSESALREPDIGRALSGSLGIALFPNHAADADSLSIAADRQRYEAQSQGKGTIRFAHG
jgi:predicted signal transduction protein with EAL and GGDEF domain